MTPYPVEAKANDTESEPEDQEMSPETLAVPESKVVDTSAALPEVKSEYLKQQEDLEAKIEAIKRQIAEQQESQRNNMLQEAF